MTDGVNVNQSRLSDIMEARRQFVDLDRKATEMVLEGRASEFIANTMRRHALEAYIVEIEHLLVPPHKETTYTEINYWTDVDVGVLTGPDGSTIAFEGLKSILFADDPMTFSWDERITDPQNTSRPELGVRTETRTKQVQIPRDILRSAYRLCNRAMAEVGLEIDPEDGGIPTYGFKYTGDPEAEIRKNPSKTGSEA